MSEFKSFGIDGRLFQVTFETRDSQRLVPAGHLEDIVETRCFIRLADPLATTAIAAGVSIMSGTDAYEPQGGYQQALQRALREAEGLFLDWDADASERLRDALAKADRPSGRVWHLPSGSTITFDTSNDDLWADRDDTLAEVDGTFEISDWHRADARRLGIEPSTPDGTVMSMYDYHRVFQALKGRQLRVLSDLRDEKERVEITEQSVRELKTDHDVTAAYTRGEAAGLREGFMAGRYAWKNGFGRFMFTGPDEPDEAFAAFLAQRTEAAR